MTMNHCLHDLTHFKGKGRITKIFSFVFLVQMKTLKFAFEINWPLVASDCVVVWFFKVSVKRHGPIVLLQDHKRRCTKWSKRAPSQIMWLTSDIKKSSPFFLLHCLQVHNGVKIIPKFLCSFIWCFTNYSWNFHAMNE